MALPAIIRFIPKLLPAAKLAYDHRDKALALYKNIQKWRSKDEIQPLQQESSTLSIDEQLDALRAEIAQRDEIITEQSDLIAKIASDLSELSSLTDKLRRRSQFLFYLLLLATFISVVRRIFF